ncbi:aspartyl protease family protein [Mesonia oceanica]|uniref:Uncharacterized protein n=1 Tax=Mesonia oceanica TaxID=2687242 RepID=A0AC61Y6W9_9FLAO|nr:aspartyl protease family protein [Mesonia oceanica]MAQ42151.1 hypothetical protein [Mesonia sp.]MBJ97979.1 hypothetical protein [Flavobacteriaceae bacterium]VVV00150.1 hypothetical protein FVB9532_01415 [Mesonia oceanica]|tara:strand:- start:880 stop:1836 length:957 start_codon:yes stop_codon:yes gene_type:complete
MGKLWLVVIFTLSFFKLQAEELKLDPIIFPNAEVVNENTFRIPFKLIDHLMVVEAELLNKKGNFIIDTGSESLILNKVHFPNLYVHDKSAVKSSGVLNDTDAYKKFLKEFKLQNLSLKNANAHVMDLSHIEKKKNMNLTGIIGYSILKDYEVFIDLYLNQITLTKIDAKGNKLDKKVYLEKIVDSIGFQLKKHTIVLTTFVGNDKMNFALDTGAEINQLNTRKSKKVIKFFKPAKRIVLSGAADEKAEVLAGKLYRVKLNEQIYFGPMNTIITNLAKMSEAFGTSVDGVLGYEFFMQKRTIINYKKEMLYFIDYPLKH